MVRFPELSVGILAGGAGRRVGGVDKGWVDVDGVPAIVRVHDAVATDVAEVIVSANRSLERYRALGLRVVCDELPGFPGPLAGVAGLLSAAATPWLVTVPVDAVAIPRDLPERLLQALVSAGCACVVVDDDDGEQPLFAAYATHLAGAAQQAFAAGERSVRGWQRGLATTRLRLQGTVLGNRNTPQ
jgi:molybdenum cofactor guanylyltransferase